MRSGEFLIWWWWDIFINLTTPCWLLAFSVLLWGIRLYYNYYYMICKLVNNKHILKIQLILKIKIITYTTACNLVCQRFFNSGILNIIIILSYSFDWNQCYIQSFSSRLLTSCIGTMSYLWNCNVVDYSILYGGRHNIILFSYVYFLYICLTYKWFQWEAHTFQ